MLEKHIREQSHRHETVKKIYILYMCGVEIQNVVLPGITENINCKELACFNENSQIIDYF